MKKGRADQKKTAGKAAPKKSARAANAISRKPARKTAPRKTAARVITVKLKPKPAARSAATTISDLPYSYNQTKLVLLVRDPEWGYSYWDFSADTWKWIEDFFHRDAGLKAKLRIQNVDSGRVWDLDVHLDAKNWYIQFDQPDASFEAELGLIDSKGRFHRIAKSNRIRTPRNSPSDKIDPEWNPENFDDIYKLSGGGRTGRGSELFSIFKRP